MSGITVKVPSAVVERLKVEARASGRSLSALIREKIETRATEARSVHDIAGELAGSLVGSGRPATNRRRKFRRP